MKIASDFAWINNLNRVLKAQAEHSPFSALGYILTTGANWAKPIENFKLTIERDKGELVSFCWDGKVNKISPTQFEMIKPSSYQNKT